MWKMLADTWCTLMHEQPMWPIHGRYECRTCGRQYPVPWAEPETGGRRSLHEPSQRVLPAKRAGNLLPTTGVSSCG
jgi:hypothetical protein